MRRLVKNYVIRQHISYGSLSKITKMTHKSWPQVSQVLLQLTLFTLQTMATSAKKSKTEERRVFNDRWFHDFLMVPVTNGMSCLECDLLIKSVNRHNANSHNHYQTNHARSYSSMTAKFRKSRIDTLLASGSKVWWGLLTIQMKCSTG